ncbi:hypothetical protein ACM40_15775 [Chryseobacterium sp. BLS98]|uniref:hypothetical protein n=1 Tax=Chryseobacterium sp. BLS98 TaxID=885586 RepID=UPI00065AA224|nr:hypothetical protein [Chryseobacterium sp. BLS98]KMQ61152.1 hypothetical protein ACM40_15775 [Chryseobacterium sp. BLS98]
MKLNCIIDTCTCIALSNTEFKQKRVLDHLNNIAVLNFSPEVHIELRDHSDKNLPKFIHNKSRKLGTSKHSISEYERRMLGKTLTSRAKKGNKGEIDNFLVSVDQIHTFKKNNVIYITDDKKALNGVLEEWAPCFPVISVWTSYEVILYLYAEKIIPSKDIANDLIQDIINFTAPKPAERSPKTTSEIMSLKVSYKNKIENISKLLN